VASKANIIFLVDGGGAQIEAVVDVRLMVNKLISIIKFKYRVAAHSERQLRATVIAVFKNDG